MVEQARSDVRCSYALCVARLSSRGSDRSLVEEHFMLRFPSAGLDSHKSVGVEPCFMAQYAKRIPVLLRDGHSWPSPFPSCRKWSRDVDCIGLSVLMRMIGFLSLVAEAVRRPTQVGGGTPSSWVRHSSGTRRRGEALAS